jgi:hypothetical protein
MQETKHPFIHRLVVPDAGIAHDTFFGRRGPGHRQFHVVGAGRIQESGGARPADGKWREPKMQVSGPKPQGFPI